MANKGETKSEKRLAASRLVPLLRKENTWHVKARPGPHKKKDSVALGFVLRDMLKVVGNMREARSILNAGKVMVDGAVAKDNRKPVGLFDLVSVQPEKKTFRVLVGRNGKLRLAEEEFGEKQKLCKVVSKRAVAKGFVQITTNDGKNFREKKPEANIGDSLLVSVPGQKVLKVLKEQPKKTVLVVGGTHVGQVAKLKEVIAGTMLRPKLVALETKDGEFQTVESNIVVVGDDKPVIKVE